MGGIAATSIQESLNSEQRAGVARKCGARRPKKVTPVKARATTQEATFHRTNGWLISLVLHGLLVSAALPLFRQLPIPIQTEPFRWEVTLVQSTPAADEPVQAAELAEQAIATSTESVVTTHHVNHPVQTNTHSTDNLASVQTITETKTEPVIATTPQPERPASVVLPTESNPATRVPESVISSSPVSEQPTQRIEPVAASVAPEPSTSTAIVPSSVDTTASASEPVQAAQTAMASPPQTNTSSAPRADYGWLQRAIFQRLEELKRSSRPSLDESRPLKVLVKAIVSNEGMLMEAEVVKSSGLDRIDQEAMALVQRAFPMRLDRTLDRQQIVMRIPITYSRD